MAHPFFDPASGFSRIRSQLQIEGQFALFHWLEDRRAERQAASQRPSDRGRADVGKALLSVCSRIYSCGDTLTSLLPIDGPVLSLSPPGGESETRTVSVSFQIDPTNIGHRPVACRAFLLDADALARLWHHVWCAGHWAEKVPFDTGAPVFVAGRLDERKPAVRRPQEIISGFTTCVTNVRPLANGGVVGLEENGQVRVALKPGEEGTQVDPHEKVPIRCLDVFPDGRRIVSADHLGGIRIWKADRAAEPTLKWAAKGMVTALAALPTDAFALGRSNGSVEIHSSKGELRTERERLHEGRVLKLVAAPGNRLVSWGTDGQLLSWDAGGGEPIIAPVMPEPTSLAVAFDGTVFSGSSDGRITRWMPGKSEVFTEFVPNCFGTVHSRAGLPGSRDVLLVNGEPICSNGASVGFFGDAAATALGVRPDGTLYVAGNGQIFAAELDRGEELDVVIPVCLRRESFTSVASARLLATLPQLVGQVQEDGQCRLTGKAPNLLANGMYNRVTTAELIENVVVVICIDASENSHAG